MVTAIQLNNGSTDNCTDDDELILAIDPATPSSFDCDDIGMQMVTLIVTDKCGNSNTCSSNSTETPFSRVSLNCKLVACVS